MKPYLIAKDGELVVPAENAVIQQLLEMGVTEILTIDGNGTVIIRMNKDTDITNQ